MGNLGVGVGTPWNGQGTGALAAHEQCISNHDSRGSVGGVSETVRRADIARGVDSRVAGLQAIVDFDPLAAVVIDAGGFEVESVNDRYAARRHQYLVSFDLMLNAFNPHPFAASDGLHSFNSDAFADIDSITQQGILENANRVGI